MKEIKINTLGKADKEGCLNEIRLLASISSPYIVKQVDAFQDEQARNLCLIIEQAEDGDLAGRINGCKKAGTMLPEDEIWKYLQNIVKGLRDLHKMKVLHRDIKSANIFLGKGQMAKIGDLNVSKLQKQGLAKTQTGTPYQCPPEIWADKPQDSKCDIWSIGIVLYEMCALKPPFDGKDMKSLYNGIKTGRYPPISNKQSKELHTILAKMLQVNPVNRPSAEDLIKYQCPNMDMNKTIAKSNSNPDLLKTIKLPNNMMQLNNILPKKKYKNDQKENVQMSRDISMASNIGNVSAINQPKHNPQGRPDSRATPLQPQNNNVGQNNGRQILNNANPYKNPYPDPRQAQAQAQLANQNRAQSPNFGGNHHQNAYQQRPTSNAVAQRPDPYGRGNAYQPTNQYQVRNAYDPRPQPSRQGAVAGGNYRPSNRLF